MSIWGINNRVIASVDSNCITYLAKVHSPTDEFLAYDTKLKEECITLTKLHLSSCELWLSPTAEQ